jgi:sulfide:quinone oxidoreductase
VSTGHAAANAPRTNHVLVVGGGNGGLSVAARLRRAGADVAVIEPSETHYFKPLFSHIAGGTARPREAARPQSDVFPKDVVWIHDSVTAVDASAHEVQLASGGVVGYDHLVLAPGIRNDWDGIPGLETAIRTPHVASNYEFDLAVKSSRLLRDVREGTVVFVQAQGPASCAGAAQKPMYQACAYWRAKGVLDSIRVVLLVPESSVYGVPEIDEELERKIEEYGIELRTDAPLRSVDADRRVVSFGAGEELTYDVLLVEPPQVAPRWIAESGLADADGFVDVDPRTLRSTTHATVWSLGDAAGTWNSKSGGALRKQAKVLAQNLTAVLAGDVPRAMYDGYGVCPFTVSRNTAVFAEFDDQGRLQPTLWRGSYKESRRNWIIDRHVFPKLYWHLILQGRA